MSSTSSPLAEKENFPFSLAARRSPHWSSCCRSMFSTRRKRTRTTNPRSIYFSSRSAKLFLEVNQRIPQTNKLRVERDSTVFSVDRRRFDKIRREIFPQREMFDLDVLRWDESDLVDSTLVYVFSSLGRANRKRKGDKSVEFLICSLSSISIQISICVSTSVRIDGLFSVKIEERERTITNRSLVSSFYRTICFFSIGERRISTNSRIEDECCSSLLSSFDLIHSHTESNARYFRNRQDNHPLLLLSFLRSEFSSTVRPFEVDLSMRKSAKIFFSKRNDGYEQESGHRHTRKRENLSTDVCLFARRCYFFLE